MSVHESVMQKILSYTGLVGNRRAASARKTHVKNVHLRAGKTAASGTHGSGRDLVSWQTAARLAAARRVVYLEGYETHEQVVRAYLEFAGIDPDSKEGRFYFDL